MYRPEAVMRPGPPGPSRQGREEQSDLACVLPPGDQCPWGRPGAVPRDCQAHRGDLLLLLGDVSLLLGALSLCLGFLALAAIACGAVAWGLACHDLRRMRARLMDPGGLADTGRARGRALAGAALGLYGAVLWACLLALLIWRGQP